MDRKELLDTLEKVKAVVGDEYFEKQDRKIEIILRRVRAMKGTNYSHAVKLLNL